MTIFNQIKTNLILLGIYLFKILIVSNLYFVIYQFSV